MTAKKGAPNGMQSRKNNKIRCKAYTYNKKKETNGCKKGVECDNCKENKCDCGLNRTYCKTHLYFEDFTVDDIKNIANGTGDWVACGRCNRWIDEDPCVHCQKDYQDKKGTTKKDIEKENRDECYAMIKRNYNETPRKCKSAIVNSNSTKFDSLLKLFNINDEYYINWIKENNILCDIHLQKYLGEMYENYLIYSHADFDTFKWCSTCRNYKNPDNFIGGLCIGCFEKSEENRLIEIEARKLNERCKYEGCAFEAIKYKLKMQDYDEEKKKHNLDNVYEDYCGNHQVYAWVQETNNNGKKVCSGWEHNGCRVVSNLKISYDKIYYCRKCAGQIKLYDYKRGAKERNLKFEYNDDEFIELMNKPCHYCNIESTNEQLNGVDRFDNSKGYIENNCVPCCEICNYLKNTKTIAEFIGMVKHILSHIGLIKKKYNYEQCFNDYNNKSIERIFCSYVEGAKNKKRAFELDMQTFSKIIEKDCYLCGKKTLNKHKNGIDRLNNGKGYIVGNTLPCCGNCNYFKHKNDICKFIYKLYKIYIHAEKIKDDLTKDKIKSIMDKYIDNKLYEINISQNELDNNETITKSINSKKIKSIKKDINILSDDDISEVDSDDDNDKKKNTKNKTEKRK
jgi:hypothetical protein